MSFDKLMQSFASQQELGELELRDNRYYLTIDTQMEVSCFQANGKFYVYGVICMLPKDAGEREEFLLRILQKNLALLMSERISLCIEPGHDELSIYECCPLPRLNEEKVAKTIASLASNFELFLKLTGHQAPSGPAASSMFMP